MLVSSRSGSSCMASTPRPSSVRSGTTNDPGAASLSSRSRTGGGMLHQLVLHVDWHLPGSHLHPRPRAIVGQGPDAFVGTHREIEQTREPEPSCLVVDPNQGLDSPVEVAVHQVGRPEIDLVVAPVVEVEDSRVLEKAAQDAPHGDPLAQAGDTGSKRAYGTNHELDPHALLAGNVEGLDDRLVDQVVDLDPDQAGLAP